MIENIVKEWENDSQIDPSELDRASLDTSKLHAKYLEKFIHAKLRVKKIKYEFAELRKLKWSYYMGRMTKEEIESHGWPLDPFNGMNKPLKGDMDMFIDTDKDIQKAKARLDYAETIFECFEEIMNNIRWRHTHIKNAIDWKRFTAGAF